MVNRAMRRLRSVVDKLQESKPARRQKTSTGCAICGHDEAYVIKTVVRPDFDISMIPPSAHARFLVKENGYCTCCGFFQDFNRVTEDQIVALNTIGKDALSTEDRLSDKELIKGMRDEFHQNYFEKRLRRWGEYFDKNPLGPVDKALFLRFWFGDAVRFAQDRFKPNSYLGMDISNGCIAYTTERFPELRLGEGQISGFLDGPFLQEGPYDLVMSFHLLSHAIEPRKFLDRLVGSLSDKGVVVFTNEIERKIANPFHFSYFSEWNLVGLLREYFSRVDRIDDCQDGRYDYVTSVTAKGDVPDFVCYR